MPQNPDEGFSYRIPPEDIIAAEWDETGVLVTVKIRNTQVADSIRDRAAGFSFSTYDLAWEDRLGPGFGPSDQIRLTLNYIRERYGCPTLQAYCVDGSAGSHCGHYHGGGACCRCGKVPS